MPGFVPVLVVLAAGMLCAGTGMAIDQLRVRMTIVKRAVAAFFYFLAVWLLCVACVMANFSSMREISDKLLSGNSSETLRYFIHYGIVPELSRAAFALAVCFSVAGLCAASACAPASSWRVPARFCAPFAAVSARSLSLRAFRALRAQCLAGGACVRLNS